MEIVMKPVAFAATLMAVFMTGAATAASGLAPDSIEYVLAVSWEPAFCASSGGRDKTECRSLTAERFDATHFALHGLWPDDLDDTAIFPCYCDRGAPVSCRESRRSDRTIALSDDVLEELSVVMPGVQSDLHRYEWSKHGSCYEDDKSGADADADPDEYFTEAMALMAQLNASPVRALFADRIGGRVTRDEIEVAFEAAFGSGASQRLRIQCGGRGRDRVIHELRINLKGDITPESELADLILAAPPTSVSSDASSCPSGHVAAAAED
jgi:ribonuclease T2